MKNLRLNLILFKNRVKAKIFDILLNLLKRLDTVKLKSALIGIKMGMNLSTVIPKDGKWHHVAMTADCWVKRSKRKTKKRKKKTYYLDGVRVRARKGKKLPKINWKKEAKNA